MLYLRTFGTIFGFVTIPLAMVQLGDVGVHVCFLAGSLAGHMVSWKMCWRGYPAASASGQLLLARSKSGPRFWVVKSRSANVALAQNSTLPPAQVQSRGCHGVHVCFLAGSLAGHMVSWKMCWRGYPAASASGQLLLARSKSGPRFYIM